MKILKIFLLLIIAVLIYSGCSKKCVGEPSNIYTTYLQLNFKDAVSGDYLIKPINGKYNKEDISITTEDNQPALFEVKINSSGNEQFNQIGIRSLFIQGDDDRNEVCKKMYINFKNDRDTLEYCFKVKYAECSSSSFEYLKLKYNGKDLGTKSNNSFFEYQINK